MGFGSALQALRNRRREAGKDIFRKLSLSALGGGLEGIMGEAREPGRRPWWPSYQKMILGDSILNCAEKRSELVE